MIQCSISKWIHSSRSTRMDCCSSILRLCSFMLFLTCLVNLIYIHTVNITGNNLVVIVSHILSVEPSELGSHSTFLSVILATLCEVYNIIASFRTSCGVSAVFERYLVLGDVDSSTSTGIGLSSSSLTAQLILIMKACICQSIQRASILFKVLSLRHQRLWSWISS
jgi:hypothetical protein